MKLPKYKCKVCEKESFYRTENPVKCAKCSSKNWRTGKLKINRKQKTSNEPPIQAPN